ncbi:MAG: glycosyltransferase [Elusimicrobiota bacterium]
MVPAYNEEKLLAACLRSVRKAWASCHEPGLEFELIVCDNASTDATARIAQEEGARVVFEPMRFISRSRNAGASAASGDWLLFIDADSELSPALLSSMLEAARSGRYVGGGSLIDLDSKPLWGTVLVSLWNCGSALFKLAAGSFVFCRADAFREVGGFPPEIAAGEELFLSRALKRWGSLRGLDFMILKEARHVSSGRKFSLYTPWEFLSVLATLLKSPRQGLKDASIHKQLYDGRR